MVKFDIQAIRFLDAQHFRVLTAVEMGMKNHELVPLPLVSSIATIHRGATARTLNDLTRSRLVVYERGKKFDGFRLTTLGYDFLALRALCSRGVVGAVGNQIGVGKESDIYVGGNPELEDLVLKFHRLGRTSFRKIKEKRDYHRRRHFCSWLYLSRLAAMKEHAFLCALHSHGFPVPKPVDICRHTVVMELITGPTLCHVSELKNPGALYEKLMKLIVRMGSYGLIHGDFNEFNIMLHEDESPIIIDFPQMVSIDHPNAEFYFDRDVQCVRTFFQRKHNFNGQEWPKIGDVIRGQHNLDIDLEASGFTKKMRRDLNRAYDEGNFTAHLDGEEGESSIEDGENDDDEGEEKEEDHEEEEGEQDIVDEQQQHLRGSERFQKWLQEARNELEALAIEEEGGSGHPMVAMGEEREARAQEVMMRKMQEERTGEEEEKKEEEAVNEDEVENVAKKGGSRRHHQPIKRANSVTTAGTSIIPPEEVKRRLLTERGKAKKEKLRVKGRQSAVRRGRQQNQELIREYAGWDEY